MPRSVPGVVALGLYLKKDKEQSNKGSQNNTAFSVVKLMKNSTAVTKVVELKKGNKVLQDRVHMQGGQSEAVSE